MQLAAVHIDRFRGLRRCAVHLADDTILIGENNCGKTSILDAIALLLSDRWLENDSSDAPRGSPLLGPLDFHRGADQAQPESIRIGLTFRERHPDEWTAELVNRLEAATWVDKAGLRTVRIRGEALPVPDAAARPEQSDASVDSNHLPPRTIVALGSEGQVLELDAAPLHETIRTLKPVLRLRNDRTLTSRPLDAMLAARPGRSRGNDGEESTASSGDDRTDIQARLAELHATLVDPELGWPDLAAEMSALGPLLDLDPDEIAAVGGSSDRLVEILRARSGRIAISGSAALPLSRQGVGTQALVLVLLLGGLIAGGTREPERFADPLVILEDPEAHLHPRTLAFLARGVAALKAQKLIVTHSGDMLANAPMESIRRLHRRGDDVRVFQLDKRSLTADESRKVNYHIRSRRRAVLFSRCWLFVEGETEFWLLPALANKLGFDLALEGVSCVEFAQCGLKPLIKTADDLGIRWHLLADGDAAGAHYTATASEWLPDDEPAERRITSMGDRDIESVLWHHGYAQIYRDAAGLTGRRPRRNEEPAPIIAKAIRSLSKPMLAHRIVEAIGNGDSPGSPPVIARAIEAAVELARAEGSGRRGRRKRSS